MIQPSNLLPNCAEGSLAKKDTFLGQVGLHGPDFESNNFRVSRLELHNLLKIHNLSLAAILSLLFTSGLFPYPSAESSHF